MIPHTPAARTLTSDAHGLSAALRSSAHKTKTYMASRPEGRPRIIPAMDGEASVNSSSPLALFITWTVYGTFLPGDRRGWRHRNQGPQLASNKLDRWHRDRLNHEIVLLDSEMQQIVESAIIEICEFRNWHLWSRNVRSNHVHVVLSAKNYRPQLVRDQLKAKATKELRVAFEVWQSRPVWSYNGDIQYLDTEREIELCTLYVSEAQDRKS
jgi:REP element-mobilizing transposase RayT